MFAIGHKRVFSLTRWFWQIHTGPHVPRATQELPHAVLDFAYRTVTFYGQAFQNVQLSSTVATRVLQPQCRRNDYWFGLFPFRSPLLRESLLFSFPLGTEMFHFPRFALRASFGRLPHSEINGYSPAYGSPLLIAVKPRPSSPFCAEASTICPSLLIRKSFIDDTQVESLAHLFNRKDYGQNLNYIKPFYKLSKNTSSQKLF